MYKTRQPDIFRQDCSITKFLLNDCQVQNYIPELTSDLLMTFLKIIDCCSVTMPEFPITIIKDESGKNKYIRYGALYVHILSSSCLKSMLCCVL
jgi:hypothetical protein